MRSLTLLEVHELHRMSVKSRRRRREIVSFGWHVQTNGMGAVRRLATPFVALRDVSLNRCVLFALFALGLVLSGCGGKPQASTSVDDKTKPLAQNAKGKPPKQNSRELAPPEVPEVIRLPGDSQETETEAPPIVGTLRPEASPAPEKARTYRPSDDRPKRNAAMLAELGIKRYASKHLELYTDIRPELAEGLPKLADQLYEALENYFGPLPPDKEGRVFQMTGYIMADPRVFRETGLLPDDLPGFNHGRHRGYEFWMNSQEYDYYLRHLMLHEATHCYMTITREQRLLPPVWYMEGMAELFGTHLVAKDGTATFRVMPHDKETFAGLGRISLIQTAVKEGRFKSLDQVFELTANDYSDNEAYAWSWALCKFLDTHPRYQAAFKQLGDAPTRRHFTRAFSEAYQESLDEMRTEWALFAHHVDEGYEIEPAAITFQPGKPLMETAPETVITLKADRGWQSTGVLIEQGKKYALAASGQFTLAQVPKPWTSEADGISFRYFGGQPLGKLLGAIHTDSPSSIAAAQSLRQVFPVGSHHTYIATQAGTLYLRLNDSWSRLSDNTGNVSVRIRLE